MPDPKDAKNSIDTTAPDSDGQDPSGLTMAAIMDQLPGVGSEYPVVHNSRTAWVRDARDTLRGTLPALGITITDRRDPGECKAALAKYYPALNATAVSKVEAPQAQGVPAAAHGPPP